MSLPSILTFAQQLIRQHLHLGEFAIDATIGTGIDTCFLAEQVGKKGRVYGFDIQPYALQLTQTRLKKSELFHQTSLFLHTHEGFPDHIPASLKGHISAVMFNLGYLPNQEADSSVITLPSSTKNALKLACAWLKKNGLITLVVYPGHQGGDEEARQILEFTRKLCPKQFNVIIYQRIQHAQAPYVIAICKLKEN